MGEYYAEAFPPRRFVPGESPVPVSGQSVRRRGNAAAGGFLARFLAHHGPLRGAVREANLRGWYGIRECVLVNSGSSANLLARFRSDVAQAGRPAPAAGRRSDHRGGRLSHHCQSDRPERPGAGVRRCHNAHLQRGCDAAGSRRSRRARALSCFAHTLGNPFDLDAVTTFAAQPRSVADRRLLRCRGRDVPRAQGGHFRRPGHRQLLSRAPHHDGRGRQRADGEAAAAHAGGIVPRLGPRLLVRSRQGQHLRQALRLAARRTAVRLRSQVHLLAHRLQPEADRHAGGRWAWPSWKSCRVSSRRAGAISRDLREGLRDLEEFFILPEATRGFGAELVRLPDRGARRMRRSRATA